MKNSKVLSRNRKNRREQLFPSMKLWQESKGSGPYRLHIAEGGLQSGTKKRLFRLTGLMAYRYLEILFPADFDNEHYHDIMPDYKGGAIFPRTDTITGDIFWTAFDPDSHLCCHVGWCRASFAL
jgi:hypothetical protein